MSVRGTPSDRIQGIIGRGDGSVGSVNVSGGVEEIAEASGKKRSGGAGMQARQVGRNGTEKKRGGGAGMGVKSAAMQGRGGGGGIARGGFEEGELKERASRQRSHPAQPR